MSTGSDAGTGTTLARALRDLRNAAGLTGHGLARRCHMTQSKISRIESGKVLPSVIDVERILQALAVPPPAARELLDLARVANVEHTSWRTHARLGLWRKQDELRALAETSVEVRHFLPAIPSGLLQTPDYARAALTPVAGDVARDVERAVRARLDRQRALDDPGRRFSFLLTEQAVRWRRAGAGVLAEQCVHLARVAERPNVDIAVLPWSVEVAGAPMNTFTVYDRRLVLVELFSGEVVLRDPRDVVFHRELFEFFRSSALTGSAAMEFLRLVAAEFMREHD